MHVVLAADGHGHGAAPVAGARVLQLAAGLEVGAAVLLVRALHRRLN
jgi:hypothetical protein